MARKKRGLNPNRFQKQGDQKFFSFDPNRRYALKWGFIAGAAGGVFMLRPEIFWQIIGVFAIVLISNYHINKISQRIPRWHATIISFLGVIIALFAIVIAGTLLINIFQPGGVNG